MDTVYQADITTAGTGYAVNDTIVLLGGALGGTDVTHNATITVDEVDAAGAITRISISGTCRRYYLARPR